MQRAAPTQFHGGTFAPLAQNDSDPAELTADVSQRWENATATEEFRSRIHSIFRATVPIVDGEDDDGLRHSRSGRGRHAYAPVGNLYYNAAHEDRHVAELAGVTPDFYAPHYPRTPSALSKVTAARTEAPTYLECEPEHKFLHHAPRVTAVEVEEDESASPAREIPHYKPFMLRRPLLCVLLLAVVVLFALMVVAVRVLPDETQSTAAAGLEARNASQIRARSASNLLQHVGVSRQLQFRQNDTSGSSNQASDVRNPGVDSTTTTSTTTTSSSSTSTSSTSSTSTTTKESSSTTTTTFVDPYPQKPPKGEDHPSSTFSSVTTIIAPIAEPTTTTTTTSERGRPTQSSPSSTDSDPQPSNGGQGPGGDKTQPSGGGGGYHPPGPDSSLGSSSSSCSSSSTASDEHNSAPSSTDNANPGTATTTTTSLPEPTATQSSSSSTTWTNESTGSDGSSHLPTGPPLSTCTAVLTQTHIQWITIPVLTVDLGLGLKGRSATVAANRVHRQATACDTTVTVTQDVTVLSTTALSTITIGLGNAPGGTAPTTTYPLNTISSTTTASLPSDGQPPPVDPTAPTTIYNTGTTTDATGNTSTDLPTWLSSTSTIVLTTIISGQSSTTTSTTVINVPPPVITNDTTVVDDSHTSPPTQSLTSLLSQATDGYPTGSTGKQPPAETHDQAPSPYTTIVQVIETSITVHTVVSTVTSVPSQTGVNGAVGMGAVFVTTDEVTSKMFITRLVTQKVITGVATDSNDGVQQIYLVTLTDNYGHPTGVVTKTRYGYLTTKTLYDTDGWPTATTVDRIMKDPSVTTMTDADGRVSVETYFTQLTTATLTDSNGNPTATQTLLITQTPTVITETDSAGRGTRTITRMVPAGTSTSMVVVTSTSTPSPATKQDVSVTPISSSGYFTGLLLPTLLAIALSIPIRILDQTVKLYQPFSAMTYRYGARTADSLYLRTTGLWGLISGITSPRTGNWLLAVTGLLVLASSVLVALSADTLRLAVQEAGCTPQNNGTVLSCATTLSMASAPARVTLGLLGLMIVLVGLAAWGLWRRRMGVWNNTPWSLSDIALLAKHDDIISLLNRISSKHNSISKKQVVTAFGNRRFVLESWQDKSGWHYGVRISNDAGNFDASPQRKRPSARGKGMPFFVLSLTGRALFLLILLGLLLLILLYRNTGGGFQKFMDSEDFGGRFILTGIGVVVSFVWWTIFTCIAFMSPYTTVVRRKSIEEVIQLSPPSNPFSGFWRVISRQYPDIYLGVVAFTAIISELLPLFLANIPDRASGVDNMSTVCVWLAVTIIIIMVLVVVWSFLIDWPDMPIDPSTIAGAMFIAMLLSEHMRRTSTSSLGGRSSTV